MLKTFMQPGQTGTARSESQRHHAAPLASARTNEPPKAEAVPEAPVEAGSKLIVGPNIKLKGSEITDCEILVVEGRVEASMNSRVIRIAEGGVFAGKAEIDVAEIHGRFEGELTARKRLVIHATGKVTGTIRYGAMSVEEGGTLAGDVATLAGGPSLVKVDAPQSASPDGETVDTADAAPTTVFGRHQSGRR
ncbi:MAG: polymer-forming cytoskeletal protein [Gammaproteobacteria bacterium]